MCACAIAEYPNPEITDDKMQAMVLLLQYGGVETALNCTFPCCLGGTLSVRFCIFII